MGVGAARLDRGVANRRGQLDRGTRVVDPETITLSTLRQLWSGAPARLDDAALSRIDASAAAVSRIVASGETVYPLQLGELLDAARQAAEAGASPGEPMAIR